MRERGRRREVSGCVSGGKLCAVLANGEGSGCSGRGEVGRRPAATLSLARRAKAVLSSASAPIRRRFSCAPTPRPLRALFLSQEGPSSPDRSSSSLWTHNHPPPPKVIPCLKLRSLERLSTGVAGDSKPALPVANSSCPLPLPGVPSGREEGDADCGCARRRPGAKALAPLSGSPGLAAERPTALEERRGWSRRGHAGRQGALLAPERSAGTGGEPGTSWSFGEARVARKGTLRTRGRLLSLWCDRSSCSGRDSVFLKRDAQNAGDYLSPSDLLP